MKFKRQKLRMGMIRYHAAFPYVPAKIVGKEDNDVVSVEFDRSVRFIYSDRTARDWVCSINLLHSTSILASMHNVYGGLR